METALALLRLALERGWALGLLFVLFCGGASATSHFGVKMPEPVTEWSAAGLLFGAAVIVVSLSANFFAFSRRKLEARAVRRAEVAETAAEAQQVLANLAALTVDDAAILRRLLASGTTRFQVDILNDAYRLLQMGLLVAVHSMGTSWICEFHPALAARREELAGYIGVELNRLNQAR